MRTSLLPQTSSLLRGIWDFFLKMSDPQNRMTSLLAGSTIRHPKNMNSRYFLTLAVVLLTFGCSPQPKPVRGLYLPKGDIGLGKTAFVELNCNRCHTVSGVNIPKHEDGWEEPLQLGGEIVRVKTYGELITAIIYPDHTISEEYKKRLKNGDPDFSPMSVLAEEMTVSQLIDLVAFLHSRYIKLEPDYTYDFYYH